MAFAFQKMDVYRASMEFVSFAKLTEEEQAALGIR
jgi:hypothetical protein